MSEPKRYLAKCPWYAIETQEHPMGEFVLYADYARLKAQAEMWEKNTQLMGRQLNDELEQVARLKAEVERLTAFTTRTIIPNEELQAQVQRLTKAGDTILSEWASGDEKDAQNFLKALVIWNAAKEGKDQP